MGLELHSDKPLKTLSLVYTTLFVVTNHSLDFHGSYPDAAITLIPLRAVTDEKVLRVENMRFPQGSYGPLTRYVNCRLRMRRECRERFLPPPISKETAS